MTILERLLAQAAYNTPDPAPGGAPDPTPAPAPAPAPTGEPTPPADPAPAATPPPAPADQSLLANPDGSAPPAPGPAMWPDDWRQQMAGDDAGLLNMLQTTASPADLAKRYREARTHISKGIQPLQLNENSTDEDIATYREANGIPANPTEYPVNFSENMQPSEADRATLDDFRAFSHENNVPPAHAQALLDWYEERQELATQEVRDNAVRHRQATEDALRQEWGADYRGNLAAIQAHMEQVLGPDNHQALVQKQFTDGTFLGDDPNFLRMFAQIAVDNVGPNALFAGDTSGAGKDLEARKNELLQLRIGNRQQQAEYNSPAVQEELQQIYQRLERLGQG